MKILLSLTLLLGFSVPAIAHNEFNGGDTSHCGDNACEVEEGPNRENIDASGTFPKSDFRNRPITFPL